MKLVGAIFDLDGTLADTLPACYVAFRAACTGLGVAAYTDEQIRGLFGPSEEGMLQRVMPERWEEGLAILLEAYQRQLIGCGGVFPSVTAALTLLRERGTPLGLVTGKGPFTTKMSLTHFGLDGVFDAVEVGSPQGVVKAAAIGRVVARWGVAADQVIYVGDAVADVTSARQAGVRPIAAAWAPSAIVAELAAAKPHALFASGDDFHAWLMEVLAR